MRFETGILRALCLLLCVHLATGGSLSAGEKKDASSAGKYVDAGSFAVFVKGQKVATETFSVEQKNGISLIKAQFKESVSADALTQKSDLQITAGGELIQYEWSQTAGGSLTVLPKNDFLIERILAPGSTKPAEQPFLMPSTSAILDNNFFVHREILAWRYLAAACKQESGALKCQQAPADFGVLIPQDHTSMHLRLELVGRAKVSIRGTDRELLRLDLMGEDYRWALWLDDHDQFKLIKVEIPADNTEVVRE